MYKKTLIRKKTYFDSVTLMSLTAKIKQIAGVHHVVIAMATDMNLDILRKNGLATAETEASAPNDLAIALELEDASLEEAVLQAIDDGLKPVKLQSQTQEITYKTIHAAAQETNSNLVVISAPGEYAAREAMLALRDGLHVMLFSDNISVAEELSLKTYAREKGLLVMGPDCGTSIINQVGLCFANAVQSGTIGLVAASGTGLQEVTVQIHHYGGGISQAIGVGGRDLNEAIGGIMMMEGIKALNQDPQTEVIVLISKPPHPAVREKIMELLTTVNKPVVINFLDDHAQQDERYHYANELVDAARLAVSLAYPAARQNTEGNDLTSIPAYGFAEEQKYLRGLYCGGTLCAEALSIGRQRLSCKSNVAKKEQEKLADPFVSVGHTLVDLGDDVFTNGRPHPMIEPSIRLDRIIAEANDPKTKVILLDFELGFGSHPDPAGITIPAIQEAQNIARRANRDLAFVGYVLGTDQDFQDKAKQIQLLKEWNVLVADSHADAIRLAVQITEGGYDGN